MKLIEVIADSGHMDALAGLAEQHQLVYHWYTKTDAGQRTSFRMLVDDDTRQPIILFYCSVCSKWLKQLNLGKYTATITACLLIFCSVKRLL